MRVTGPIAALLLAAMTSCSLFGKTKYAQVMPDPIPDAVFPVHVKGGRVELRELTREDLEPIAEYAADLEVMRYVVFGRTFSTEEEREWLEVMMTAARAPQRDDYTLAVVVDGAVAGTAHLGVESRLHFRGRRVERSP